MQNTRFENYMSQLESRLKHLTSAQREEEMREVRGHLETLASWHTQQGKNPEDAVQEAIRQFGKAEQIGRELNDIALRKSFVSSASWIGQAFAIWCCLAALHFLIFSSMNDKPSDFPHLLWSRWIISAMLATSMLFINHFVDKAIKKWNSRRNVA